MRSDAGVSGRKAGLLVDLSDGDGGSGALSRPLSRSLSVH